MDFDSTMIEKKSLEIFSIINKKEIQKEKVIFELIQLNGISNKIYRVKMISPNNSQHFEISNLFFKIFGKNSNLINREYETKITSCLSEYGLSAKIYDSDNKTYRVEEYLDGYETLNPNILYDQYVFHKIIRTLAFYNTLLDVNTYASIMSNNSKNDYFNLLLNDHLKFNVIAFLLKVLRPVAKENYYNFKKDSQENKDNLSFEFNENCRKLENYVENFDLLLLKMCPEKGILVLAHNDSHCLNFLSNKDLSKIILVDHEYGYFNFLGYDIINYFLESMFYLTDDKFPFYQVLNNDFTFLLQDSTLDNYIMFLNHFKHQNKHLFFHFNNFDELFDMACTKEYYMRIVAINSLFILLFSLMYLDYDSMKKKNSFDYFSYIVDRMKGFEFAVQFLNIDILSNRI